MIYLYLINMDNLIHMLLYLALYRDYLFLHFNLNLESKYLLYLLVDQVSELDDKRFNSNYWWLVVFYLEMVKNCMIYVALFWLKLSQWHMKDII